MKKYPPSNDKLKIKTMNISLVGSCALVTGGSRGIGNAIASVLARCGASVAVTSRTMDAAVSAAAGLPVVHEGQRHVGVQCDVGVPDRCEDAVATAENSLQSLDILVNAAGITYDKLLLRTRPEEADEVVRVNLMGTIHCTRVAAKHMIRNRKGVIVNVGSVVGSRGSAGQAVYSASKSALEGFTRSTAQELGARGVRANLIVPGFIETDMTATLSDARKSEIRQSIPSGQFGTPENIAHVAAFLCSPYASYVNGTTISVDGCMRL